MKFFSRGVCFVLFCVMVIIGKVVKMISIEMLMWVVVRIIVVCSVVFWFVLLFVD